MERVTCPTCGKLVTAMRLELNDVTGSVTYSCGDVYTFDATSPPRMKNNKTPKKSHDIRIY